MSVITIYGRNKHSKNSFILISSILKPNAHTGWGNRIFTPTTTQLYSRGGENSIVPPCTYIDNNACNKAFLILYAFRSIKGRFFSLDVIILSPKKKMPRRSPQSLAKLEQNRQPNQDRRFLALLKQLSPRNVTFKVNYGLKFFEEQNSHIQVYKTDFLDPVRLPQRDTLEV